MKLQFRPTKKEKTKKISSLFSIQPFLSATLKDWGLIYCILGLMVFGWIMVYSSSALVAEVKYGDQYHFLKRQFIWSLIGILAFIIASNVRIDFWQKSTRFLYFLTLVLLAGVLIFGPEIAGAKRWFRVAGVSFQPSELAKLTLVFLAADYMDRRQSRLVHFQGGLLPLFILTGIPLVLIGAEPDLGTPVLMGGVFVCLLVLGGAQWKHLFLLAMGSLPLVILAATGVKYRLARLTAYLDPWSDPQGSGYQLIQSLLALGLGGIFGRGLGNSKIKISSLPDAHTDFIFSVMGEELGLIGTLLCASLFMFLCLRGLKISHQAPTLFSKLVAAGISLTIGFQAVVNMGVACGMFPTKGMPLPFISFGGSSLVVILLSLGVLARIARTIPPTQKEAK